MNNHTLYNLTLTVLCGSLNEEDLKRILKSSPPQIILQIIWKLLNVNYEDEKFAYNHTASFSPISSVARGRELARPLVPLLFNSNSNILMSDEVHEDFGKHRQTKFEDKLNICEKFDLDLFFKLIGVATYRTELFTIFQICVQRRGFEFPKQLAIEWIENSTQEDDECFHHIEQGLKLGTFLGDSGWLSESALVLSHTYDVISNKWLYPDQHLKLTKIIQCLTKWLLVVSNFNDFDEAKIVLHHMLCTISILEKMKERTLSLAYAYIAVSQYYYVLMEFNESWPWTIKAIDELNDESSEVLKLIVISHVIKVCSALNKLGMAKKLINQLHTYEQEIEQNIHIDMLLNEACYSLKADLVKDSISSYYNALDSRRNLFGYYNLHTATVFVDYAYARYVCDYAYTDYNEAMHSVSQGIFIMKKIGLPDDNMLLVNAGRIKALVLEEKALNIINRGEDILMFNGVYGRRIEKMLTKMKEDMLNEAENLHLKALELSLKVIGEKALFTAKSFCNLGRLYQSQNKYKQCEQMHLKAIQIKESILGKDHSEVALSLGHLASLYTYQMKKYKEAEPLLLRSKTIYETTYGHQYTGLFYDIQGLAEVYRGLDDNEKFHFYIGRMIDFHVMREAWLRDMHAETHINCKKNGLSLETFRCILNDCSGGCEK